MILNWWLLMSVAFLVPTNLVLWRRLAMAKANLHIAGRNVDYWEQQAKHAEEKLRIVCRGYTTARGKIANFAAEHMPPDLGMF